MLQRRKYGMEAFCDELGATDGDKFSENPFREIIFTINGKKYTVDHTIPPDTTLNTFIRNHAKLTGTKSMCHEGGCGACVVMVKSVHPFKEEQIVYAVNSCLILTYSCHGWAITTIEGIGNKREGYDKVQTRLAQLNGSQCGYCSPGMVMNMYCLLQCNENITMKDVENSFGGNICRCTGYRPILDAFKSLSTDAPQELVRKVQDIEDLYKIKPCVQNAICGKSGDEDHAQCNGTDVIPREMISPIHIQSNDAQWFKVSKLSEIFDIFSKIDDAPYRLVAGNTGQGVFRVTEKPEVYIDIGDVAELKSQSVGAILILGGNMSLTEAMNLFNHLSETNVRNYKFLKILADHIDLIANVPVRNTGTLAGNLLLKHDHCEFPSDIFLILETVGASLTIATKEGLIKNVSMTAFLDMEMKHRIVYSINIPSMDRTFYARTFKVMPRAQNAHAYVNAGFLFKLERGKIISKPTIVYGGINPEFIHAFKTESFLHGKNLFDHKILRTALKMLDSELELDHVQPDATPCYRRGLSESLLFRCVLGLCPSNLIKQNLKSGGKPLERPISSGKQDFDTNTSEWPLNKPIPKMEAVAQCSGEAEYVNDIATLPGELYAAFAITTVGRGYITNIDPSEALKIPGVAAFITDKDIPGENNFIPVGLLGMTEKEELFCSGNVKYAGQPFGIILATSFHLAHEAALKVKVEYTDVKIPQIDMREVMASGDQSRIRVEKEPDKPEPHDKSKVTHVIKGSFDMGSQYHYTMETQSCVCVPIEDGLDVYPASQWIDLTQRSISQVLKVRENSINVRVRRLGGGYGSKISRSAQVSSACALAAHILNRPVRFVMNLETNMSVVGKRYNASADYEVETDDEGHIYYMKLNLHENAGCAWNESVSALTTHHMKSCYDKSTWEVTAYGVQTDTASNTYCRAPSSTEGIGIIENIMEHVSKVTKRDPIEVRINNMDKSDEIIQRLIEDMKVTADYKTRQESVESYNKEQRWKKRGISLVPMVYEFPMWGNFSAIVSIYAEDGTVAVSHGGIEMGQGINTKVAQVVAYALDVPLDYVSVKPSNNLTSPNGMVTGGSITSEVCAYAAMVCCEMLNERLEPVKEGLKDCSWEKLTQAAYHQNVDLCATYMFTPKDNVKPYNIYGVAVAEVELDLLTGQHQILRVDILEDAGESLSPEIDVGQVEGAFVMGIGYWLMEDLVHNPETGELLTNRTWNYKPPGVKDIPIDFRIYLRKNAPNPFGVLRSKATGEPPLCMSCVVFFAIRNALTAARIDAGQPDEWYPMNAPATAENIFLTSLTNINLFSL